MDMELILIQWVEFVPAAVGIRLSETAAAASDGTDCWTWSVGESVTVGEGVRREIVAALLYSGSRPVNADCCSWSQGK